MEQNNEMGRQTVNSVSKQTAARPSLSASASASDDQSRRSCGRTGHVLSGHSSCGGVSYSAVPDVVSESRDQDRNICCTQPAHTGGGG